MSEIPPTQTLTPSMDAHDSSDQSNPSEVRLIETLTSPMDACDSSDQSNPSEIPPDSSAADTNLPEKRKRESEPDPETPTDPTQPQKQHPMSKTSLCSYFRRFGESCSHGESCRYAHGEAELKPRPDNTWDPTSERAKKLAKTLEKEAAAAAEKCGVMMTDAVEGNGEESSPGLSKCLVNLPMKWSSDNLRSFLTEQGIVFKSAKKKKGMIVGFATFESAEKAKIAAEELDGKSIGNNRTLKVSDVIPRPFEKSNKVVSAQKLENTSTDGDMNESASNDENGNLVTDGSVSKGRSARDAVTPLAHMSYSDQLEHKKNSLAQTLKKLTRNARKACPNGVSLPEWILNAREIGGLPCKLEGIIESPLVNGYRNKCEFSGGGVLTCPNVSKIACKYATVFQEFLQQHSALPVWNRLNNSGFWRQLTVREGKKDCQIVDVDNPETNISEVLLIVQVCTKGFDDGQVKDELERLAQAFSVGSPPLPLTAFVVQ
ncbi:hypothetical protein MIMGU_mgv1a0189601mg, partial [Erythranthe guttata]